MADETHKVLLDHVADAETLQARNDQALSSPIRHIKKDKSHAASFAYALNESGLLNPTKKKANRQEQQRTCHHTCCVGSKLAELLT